MEEILRKLTEKYTGWTLISLTTLPTASPSSGRTVIVTIDSPPAGDSPTIRKTVIFRDVLPSDISEGQG